MKRLTATGKHLDLSNYEVSEQFEIFDLANYDFEENLDFDNKMGVYIFTRRDIFSIPLKKYKREVFHHNPLYCGMTGNFNKRFNDHFKADDLVNSHCNRISIYYCENEAKAVELEEKILSLIKFPYNVLNNQDAKYKKDIKLIEV